MNIVDFPKYNHFNKNIMELTFIMIILLFPFIVFSEEQQQKMEFSINKEEVLSHIKQAASTVQTISAEFIQEKHLEILKNASISKGRFFYQNPDRLRWEVYEPVSMGFIINGNKGKRWKDRSDDIQSFDLKNEPIIQIISDQVFAWAMADFKRLEAGYDITVLEDSPAVLKLIPFSATEKKYLEYIKLTFSTMEDYVTTIEIHEAGGDYTQINFTDIAVNKIFQEDIF